MPQAAPLNPRAFTPVECARIMGFPEGFELAEIDVSEGDSSQGVDAADSSEFSQLKRQLLQKQRPGLTKKTGQKDGEIEESNGNDMDVVEDRDEVQKANTDSGKTTSTSSALRSEKALIRAQYRMLGNAVCPPVIAPIAASVIGHMRALENIRSENNTSENTPSADSIQNYWLTRGFVASTQLAVQAIPASADGPWTLWPGKQTQLSRRLILMNKWSRETEWGPKMDEFLFGGDFEDEKGDEEESMFDPEGDLTPLDMVSPDDTIRSSDEDFQPKRRRLSEEGGEVGAPFISAVEKLENAIKEMDGEVDEEWMNESPADDDVNEPPAENDDVPLSLNAKKKAEKAKRKEADKERKKAEKKKRQEEKKQKLQNMRSPEENNGREKVDNSSARFSQDKDAPPHEDDNPDLTFRLVEVEVEEGEKKTKNHFIQLDPYEVCMVMYAKRRMLNRELLEVFTKEFVKETREYYEKAITEGRIKVNKQIVDPSYLLKDNDLIEHFSPGYVENLVLAQPIKVLEERCCNGERFAYNKEGVVEKQPDGTNDAKNSSDDHLPGLLVVEKPAGLPVHPAGSYRHLTLTKYRTRTSKHRSFEK